MQPRMQSPVALLPDALKALLAPDNAATRQVAGAWADAPVASARRRPSSRDGRQSPIRSNSGGTP